MPPVVVLALGAIGAALIGRWIAREAGRINAELHRRAAEPVAEGVDRDKLPRLERDPVTGVYRPK